ncbi:hypothetical protein SAMN05216368_11232 [Cryobacterium flavum]|uniref:TPM domain-containing protein n=1 Tax=Cryobacterium flavum TaxID=1424659 RepID=A0A4R8UWE0_9MICO|nr:MULTISPECIES: hypothetical protein [Cryobacterium]TFB72027.1 hypothetical protein E3O21_19525 [Cryobacterium flavum]SDO19298.1 hypothetical protein SAMN05216368_11232 [Cryobacterium flavum]
MNGDLWWVPSVIVIGLVVAGVWALVGASRRRTRARLWQVRAVATELERNASSSLVRADDVVQDATDELSFAIAQFGESATREFATALATSRRQLSDAFALQQKLDDAVPDSALERNRWNHQIVQLADEATGRLTNQARDFTAKRGVERNAPQQIDELRRRQGRVSDRVAGGASTLTRLGLSYSAAALAPISGNVDRARTALDAARASADAAAARLAATEPVGEQLQAAEHALFQATQLLDAIETGEDQLHRGFANLQKALDAAGTELAEARALRDGHEESDTSASLNQVIADAASVQASLREPGRPSDPAADLVTLEAAMNGLDSIRSEARNRQLRLDNARTALAGALLTARSQITVTRDFVAAHRGRVQAAARTRLAEAERQLALAVAESDPVTALDTARRAMTLATDADALARYDTH